MIIIPLVAPSYKLKLYRFSPGEKFKIVAICTEIHLILMEQNINQRQHKGEMYCSLNILPVQANQGVCGGHCQY